MKSAECQVPRVIKWTFIIFSLQCGYLGLTVAVCMCRVAAVQLRNAFFVEGRQLQSCPAFPRASCVWAGVLCAVGTGAVQGSSGTGTNWGCSVLAAGEGDPGKANGRRKGKASFLGVSSACAGLLPWPHELPCGHKGEALAGTGILAACTPAGLSTHR